MLESVVAFVFLCFGSIYDLNKKSVPLIYLYIGGILDIVYLFIQFFFLKTPDVWRMALYGAIPGLVCLFFSYVSKEQIGYGDGWIVVLLGISFGAKKVFLIVLTALFCLAFISLILLVMKKVTRKTRIPFIPFLLVGNIFVFLQGRLQ